MTTFRNAISRNSKCGIWLFLILLPLISCKDDSDGDQVDVGYVNITINPNSTQYLELNTVGGWLYLTASAPSRGIIVYRMTQDQFNAFDRTPPSNANDCCNKSGCTRLIVDYPYVTDTCVSYNYLILDGSPLAPATKMLIQYRTFYDGNLLQITN